MGGELFGPTDHDVYTWIDFDDHDACGNPLTPFVYGDHSDCANHIEMHVLVTFSYTLKSCCSGMLDGTSINLLMVALLIRMRGHMKVGKCYGWRCCHEYMLKGPHC